MVLEDFVMLGRTVPEQSKKHGLVVCSAGYSRELRQFLRIYPVHLFDRVPRWSQCRVRLRRNPSDSRIESWRIAEGDSIDVLGRANRHDEWDFLRTLATGSIAQLNEQRASLGLLVPTLKGFRFHNMSPNEEFLLPLFPGDLPDTRLPRILFDDEAGAHDLQLRDWGSHLFLMKQPTAQHGNLWSALKLTDPQYDHLFLVGNHAQHRNSWLIISVLSERNRPQCAFDFGEP